MNTGRIEFEKANSMEHDALIVSVIGETFSTALSDPTLMHDLLQEGRIAVWLARGTHDPELSVFSTWAYYQIRGAVSEYLRKMGYPCRKGAKDRRPETLPIDFEERFSAPGIEETGIPNEAIQDLLNTLTSKHREIVVRFLGLDGHDKTSFTTIAAERGVTPSAVAQYFRNALKKMRIPALKMRKDGFLPG